MILAKNAVPGRFYRRTRKPGRNSYYEVPRIGRDAYLVSLRRREAKHTILCGQEASNLRMLGKDPEAIVLRFTVRYRTIHSRVLTEKSHLVVVSPDLKLREVKHKPTR